jgi:hypothetical protein
MISDGNIWRIARQLVSDYSAGAPPRAALEAEVALAKGNVDDIAAWKQILAATRTLLQARSRRPQR